MPGLVHWVHHISNFHHLAERLFPQSSVKPAAAACPWHTRAHGLGERPNPPGVHEEPRVTSINPSLPHQGWLWTWIPDGRCELALCFADKSQFCHFLWVPLGSSERSVLDARCHVAAKLTGEDPSEGTGGKQNLWCAISLQGWRILNAQGEEVSFIVFLLSYLKTVLHISHITGAGKRGILQYCTRNGHKGVCRRQHLSFHHLLLKEQHHHVLWGGSSCVCHACQMSEGCPK